eukprot:687225-Ditylum_brightwellii.AAC.1
MAMIVRKDHICMRLICFLEEREMTSTNNTLSIDEYEGMIGVSNSNPVLSTDMYNIDFDEEVIKPYAANIIAKNILNQVDQDEYVPQYLKKMLDYAKDGHVVTKNKQFATTKQDNRKMKWTAVGRKFQIL